jgi:ferredoxin-type protein NapF
MSSKQVDVARRSFLRGNMLTKEGRSRDQKIRQPLGPVLPWFEPMNQETCGDCAQPCVSSCPQGVIRIHPESHTESGTPYLDFSSGGCNFCGDCGIACPEGMADVRDAAIVMMGPVKLDMSMCHAWNGIFCMSCIGRCDTKALSLDQRRRVHVNDNLCTGCGFCVASCPGDALSVTVLEKTA